MTRPKTQRRVVQPRIHILADLCKEYIRFMNHDSQFAHFFGIDLASMQLIFAAAATYGYDLFEQ